MALAFQIDRELVDPMIINNFMKDLRTKLKISCWRGNKSIKLFEGKENPYKLGVFGAVLVWVNALDEDAKWEGDERTSNDLLVRLHWSNPNLIQ